MGSLAEQAEQCPHFFCIGHFGIVPLVPILRPRGLGTDKFRSPEYIQHLLGELARADSGQRGNVIVQHLGVRLDPGS